MKKLTVAALALTTLLSGNAFAHEAGEFFIRAGSATVRPTEGAGGTLGSLGGFDVSNNTCTTSNSNNKKHDNHLFKALPCLLIRL